MNSKIRTICQLVCVATFFVATATLSAQSITYQGELNQSGSPADGQFDMEFSLWDSPTGGSQVDSFSATGVSVSNGRFTAELTFDVESFSDSGRWLEIEVDGSALQPRQAVNHAPYALQTRGFFVNSVGNVGLGTESPLAKFHVIAPSTNGGNNTAFFFAPNLGPYASAIHFGLDGDWFIRSSTEEGKVVMQDTGGRVGVGVFNPGAKLHVTNSSPTAPAIIARNTGQNYAVLAAGASDAAVTGGGLLLVGDSEASTNIAIDDNEIMARNNGSAANLNLNADGAAVIIGVNSNGSGRLITPIVQITGGSDFSEMFDVRGETKVKPGMVVAIDPENPGSLVPSSQAHDRRVAGIISGAGGVATGMTMGQAGTIADGEYPVALSGRVYCLVDATDAAIEPGDLLTTSSTVGHAMKVEDPDSASGATIGKAMTKLARGEKGLVLVLVNLQ